MYKGQGKLSDTWEQSRAEQSRAEVVRLPYCTLELQRQNIPNEFNWKGVWSLFLNWWKPTIPTIQIVHEFFELHTELNCACDGNSLIVIMLIIKIPRKTFVLLLSKDTTPLTMLQHVSLIPLGINGAEVSRDVWFRVWISFRGGVLT